MDKEHSALDGIPVDDSEWNFKRNTLSIPLEVIGACPHCGAPIYGRKNLWYEEEVLIKRSCNCPSAMGNSFL